MTVIAALGNTGNPRVVQPLIDMLNDPSPYNENAAARALSSINDPRAVSALLAAMKERNTAVIAGAILFFIRRGEARSEGALIEALNQNGDPLMARAFRNSGNAKLEKAGRTWTPRAHKPSPTAHLALAEIDGLRWGAGR